MPAEGRTLLKDREVHFSASAEPPWLRHLGQIEPRRPHYITKNRGRFHYESDGGRRVRVYLGWGAVLTTGIGPSDHICYLLLISCHVIIPKCELTARKLSRKLTGPEVARTRAFAVHPVDPRSCSSLIYCARIAEPAGGPSADTCEP